MRTQTPPPQPPPPVGHVRPPRLTTGEPFVWGTAMGLTVGLAMILYLLGLILVNGAGAFWPKRVAWLELRADSTARLGQAPALAGEVVRRQPKHAGRAAGAAAGQEWQLFLGNKDAYGLAFRYVDLADVLRVRYPPELMVIERREYGDAIGIPVALQIRGEGVLQARDPRFEARLQQLVAEGTRHRARLRRLEKAAIGTLNARLAKLRRRQRALERAHQAGKPVPAAAWQQLQENMAALQARYAALARQARGLREHQQAHALVYRLATGEKRRLPLGQIVHYYYPNRLTTGQRLGLLLRNLWTFLSQEPREANTEGGIFPALFGTLVMTVLMSLAVTPFGVLAAVYLREYARQGPLVRVVRIAVNNLAGVPSIVFGVFGLGFFVYLAGGTLDKLFFADALPTPTFGTGGLLWASLTLALMTVPVVIVATEEALAAVPRGMREGSLALGASKWQTIQRIVLPAAAPGILTGLILAMARGAGEVAPLMLVGVVKLAPSLPIDNVFPFLHLERKFMHLGFHIYDLGFQSPDAEAAKPMVFATTLLLITLVVTLNLGAMLIREKLRRKYATGAVYRGGDGAMPTPVKIADPILEIQHLSLYYGTTPALRDITLSIPRKRVTAFIGPSGCGKSTLLRCFNRMNDLIENVRIEGSIKLDGEEINDPTLDVIHLRRRVGMVFQKSNPFPKSIYENVIYGLRIAGVRNKAIQDATVERSLRAAALWDEVKDRLRESALRLSGGQMQRLCIARAIAVNPDIILMDEPCSALDPIATSRIEDLIDELKQDYTVIIVTHNMQQAARVSDYTAFLYLGELVEFDETNRIFTAPEQKRTQDYITGRFG